MSAGANARRVATLEDFLAIPEARRFHELILGTIEEKATPSGEHGGAQGGLLIHLGTPFQRRSGSGGGPGGWWFASEVEVRFGGNVCRPDVLGWRRERVVDRPRGTLVEVIPDWICEVLSADDATNDTVRKKHIYHLHRVEHYWLADPVAGSLFVYRWHPDGYLEVLAAERGQRVRAEPFQSVELSVTALLGGDDEGAE